MNYYINNIVDYMFQTHNDRQALKALFSRRMLNLTPREVGRILNVSAIKVNMLVQMIPHKRLNDSDFNKRYLQTAEAIEKHFITNQFKSHLKHVTDVNNRLKKKITS